jgi:hypothetical protein
VHNQDEIMHTFMLQAQQQHQDMRLGLVGHIADYDYQTHSVTVYFPTLRDDTDQPLKSPWIPIGTGMVGNQYGIQIAPHGGATPANPTQGEQVLVSILERETGSSAVANLHYTDQHQPPYDFGSNQHIQPGEIVVKHESGSYVRFRASGDVEVHSNRDIIATSGRDCNITSTRNTNITATDPGVINCTGAAITITADTTDVTVTATRAASVTAGTTASVTAGTAATVTAGTNATVQATGITNIYGGTQVNAGNAVTAFLTLLTSVFLSSYNSHTHSTGAGTTGPPLVTVPATYPNTTVITAAN